MKKMILMGVLLLTSVAFGEDVTSGEDLFRPLKEGMATRVYFLSTNGIHGTIDVMCGQRIKTMREVASLGFGMGVSVTVGSSITFTLDHSPTIIGPGDPYEKYPKARLITISCE